MNTVLFFFSCVSIIIGMGNAPPSIVEVRGQVSNGKTYYYTEGTSVGKDGKTITTNTTTAWDAGEAYASAEKEAQARNAEETELGDARKAELQRSSGDAFSRNVGSGWFWPVIVIIVVIIVFVFAWVIYRSHQALPSKTQTCSTRADCLGVLADGDGSGSDTAVVCDYDQFDSGTGLCVHGTCIAVVGPSGSEDELCEAGMCLECVNNTCQSYCDASSSTPYCGEDGSSCVACAVDAHCAWSPDGPFCSASGCAACADYQPSWETSSGYVFSTQCFAYKCSQCDVYGNCVPRDGSGACDASQWCDVQTGACKDTNAVVDESGVVQVCSSSGSASASSSECGTCQFCDDGQCFYVRQTTDTTNNPNCASGRCCSVGLPPAYTDMAAWSDVNVAYVSTCNECCDSSDCPEGYVCTGDPNIQVDSSSNPYGSWVEARLASNATCVPDPYI